jgi:hypothetical protein
MPRPETLNFDPTEPAVCLTERALDGYSFLSQVCHRERRRLRRRLARRGRLSDAEALAAVTVVQVALAEVSPLNRRRLAERFRRELRRLGRAK